MSDGAFFLGRWKFQTTHGSLIYPETGPALIEREGTQFKITWLDTAGNEHVLHNLSLSKDDKLVGPAQDKEGDLWPVTIERDAATSGLKGAVEKKSILPSGDFSESSLAGIWGAEAAPPIQGDDGPPNSSR